MESRNILKGGAVVLGAILLFFLAGQIRSFLGETSQSQKDFVELEGKLQQARMDQQKFNADLDYYLNPENLKKEIKGRFNYKEPGEKMLILVNKDRASSTSSSTRK